jgi:hypothetical protein
VGEAEATSVNRKERMNVSTTKATPRSQNPA